MFFDMYGSKEMAEEKRKKMDMFKQINLEYHQKYLMKFVGRGGTR